LKRELEERAVSDHPTEEDEYGLGPGTTLTGATTVAIGPSSPVRVSRCGVETVEYAVLMVVEMPTTAGAPKVTLEFTALFASDPTDQDAETYLHPTSLN